MDDIGFGRLIRLARIRRGWRQLDLAAAARVSPSAVSRLERGELAATSLAAIRRVAATLDIRVELLPRARAAAIDRALNARHAALAEYVTGWISGLPGWTCRPEVSFSEFGERGAVDVLATHRATRAVLVVELKTELIDVGGVLATLDRKHRLARVIARGLGWEASLVGSCLLLADSTTNHRRAAEHRALLRSALPDSGPALRRWLRRPSGELRALRFVSDNRPGRVRRGFAAQIRVARPRRGGGPASARSAVP